MKIKSYLFDISSLNEESFSRLLLGVKKYRREKIDKLSLQKNKYLSLGVEILIKKACEDFGIDYLNEDIIFNEYGKPAFKSSKYFFNTAHSGKYAFCVVSDIQIGCDIEEIKEYKERVAERFFSEKERKYIEISPNKDEMFYRLWTLKESYLKCIGTGLSTALNSFELDNDGNNVIIKGQKDYQFIEVKYDNYRIAYCLKISDKEKEKYQHDISLIQFH